MADIRHVLMENYLPYAKGTIVARAIPAIDGLKPVNRRILYTMYKMGLLNHRSKSANIVGATMRLHPHGDMAIYEALVRMTTGHEALNEPYVESKGSFGKFYSRDTDFAAPRYTEAKLAEICKEIFDGINEDAVRFVPNYDNTDKEPIVLPVKFPSILVNTSSGIAVGTSSSIPPFNLREVCDATIGILEGKIKDAKDLAEVMKAPDFPTGGFIHGTDEDFIKLLETGQGSFTVSGKVEIGKNKIIITEVPYKVEIETIFDEIRDCIKNGQLDEIADIRDESDLRGLRAVVELKRDADPRKVLRKLAAYTKLRTQVSFVTRVILEKDGKQRCVTLGILDLLKEWINFRMEVIKRIYTFRLEKRLEQEHLLEVWEKIKDDIREVASYIANNSEEAVAVYLKNKYGFDDIQIEYLMDMKIKELTPSRLEKKLAELDSVRKDIEFFKKVVEDDEAKKNIMIEELRTIKNKYGKDRKTLVVGPVDKSEVQEIKEEVKDFITTVIITKNGYMKKFDKPSDEDKLQLHEGDDIRWRYTASNKDVLLIFTYAGNCYKVPINNIDNSRGIPRDYIYNFIDDGSEVLLAVPSYMYKGSINVVYGNGKAVRIAFSKVSGNRSKYRNVFEGGEPGSIWATIEDKYFIITWNKKAAYTDASVFKGIQEKATYRVARLLNGEKIFGIQPLSKVPNVHNIDLSRYSRGYCVKITEPLW